MLQQGAYGCVHHPKLNCDGAVNTSESRNEHVTKIQEDNHVAQNEYRIGEMIRTIPNYELRFLPTENICKVSVKKNIERLRGCEVITRSRRNNKYVLLTIPYKKGDGVVRYVKNKMSSKKEKISLMFDIYRTLLNSIEVLVKHQIVHFDLHVENVHIHSESEVPFIIDFGLSVRIDEITERDCTIFGPEADWWCLDINMLALLRWKHGGGTLYDFVREQFTDEHFLVQMLTSAEMDAFRSRGTAYIERHMEMTPIESEKLLWEGWRTWDNYSLSVIMLKLVYTLFGKRYRENEFTEGFVQLLLTNMDADPRERLSVPETKQRFEQLFYTVDDPRVYLDMLSLFQEDV